MSATNYFLIGFGALVIGIWILFDGPEQLDRWIYTTLNKFANKKLTMKVRKVCKPTSKSQK